MDGICGDLSFEDGGNPTVMNRLFAAADPVLCDAYVCKLMGYEVKEVPYIGMAENLGAGCGDLGRACIREQNCAGDSGPVKMPDKDGRGGFLQRLLWILDTGFGYAGKRRAVERFSGEDMHRARVPGEKGEAGGRELYEGF